MGFDVREFLYGIILIAMFVCEAKGEEIIGTVVVLGISHDGLLRHTNYIPRGDTAAVCEGEIF